MEEVAKNVSDFWMKKPSLYPIALMSKSIAYNPESGDYCNIESVDFSNKMIPK